MELSEFKNQLLKLREAVTAALPGIAETLVISAKAMAERNMKEAGFGVTYSTRQVPAWFFHGKELNQRGTKYLEQRGVDPGTGSQGTPKMKRKKKGETEAPGQHLTTTTWGEFRTAQGLQAAFVDLSYSNKMWANMQPVSVEETPTGARAFLGATNREAQNKMNWNRDRYGDFIRKSLNEEDGKVLGQVAIDSVEDVIKQIL